MKKIQLYNRNGLINKFVLVDNKDFQKLNKLRWTLHTGNYVYARNRHILMHRFILNVTNRKLQVDHIDHDTLNNQRKNLRICNNQENHYNQRKRKNTTSKYKGVYWNSTKKKWQVSVKIKETYKTKNLGRFDNEKEAALVYDEYAKKYYGKFALLNFT